MTFGLKEHLSSGSATYEWYGLRIVTYAPQAPEPHFPPHQMEIILSALEGYGRE